MRASDGELGAPANRPFRQDRASRANSRTKRTAALAALEPYRQVVRHVVDRDPLLRHGVTLAHRHGVVLERVEIDGQAVRRTDLVLATVAPADSAGIVEIDVPRLS